MRSVVESCPDNPKPKSSRRLLLNAETIQDSIESTNVDATISNRDTAPMVPRSDLISAGPELLARFSVESIEGGVRGARNSPIRSIGKTHVRICLLSVLPVAVSEDHAIGDHGRLSTIHVA